MIGTMVKVKTQCFNPHCPSPVNTWKSQPTMIGTKMSAMNFLLCFSVLVSGASPSKTFLVFRNMGLSCISLKTYFKHQAVSTLFCNNSSLTNRIPYLSIILRNFKLYYLEILYVGLNHPHSREICPDDYRTVWRETFIAECMKCHSIPWIV